MAFQVDKGHRVPNDEKQPPKNEGGGVKSNFQVKIESNVAPPEYARKQALNAELEEAFSKMNIGDSFEFPEEIAGKVTAASSKFRKLFPEVKHTIRTVGEGRRRLWRIA